jgi:hypothetical protein
MERVILVNDSFYNSLKCHYSMVQLKHDLIWKKGKNHLQSFKLLIFHRTNFSILIGNNLSLFSWTCLESLRSRAVLAEDVVILSHKCACFPNNHCLEILMIILLRYILKISQTTLIYKHYMHCINSNTQCILLECLLIWNTRP